MTVKLNAKQRKRLGVDQRHLVVLQKRLEKAEDLQRRAHLEPEIRETEQRIRLAQTNPEFY